MGYKEVLPIWWSIVWRGTLVGFLAGFVAGAIIGFAFTIMGYAEVVAPLSSGAGLMLGILASLWATKSALNKHRLRPESIAA
ncbi:hypothetical protein [Citreimonas sp.]|uniref:hypothetical protein n=1 Tax=Citreimonas sp. TaxID=3036715 RepID=UPI0035C7E42F